MKVQHLQMIGISIHLPVHTYTCIHYSFPIHVVQSVRGKIALRGRALKSFSPSLKQVLLFFCMYVYMAVQILRIFLSCGGCTDSIFLKHKGCAHSIFLSRRGCIHYIFLSRLGCCSFSFFPFSFFSK